MADALMTCRRVQRLVTDLFEGVTGPITRLRIRVHLLWCGDCRRHVDKMGDLISALGQIPPETEVPPTVIEHFRKWKGRDG